MIFQVIQSKGSAPIRPRKPAEQLVQEMKPNTYTERNPFRRAGFARNNVSGNFII